MVRNKARESNNMISAEKSAGLGISNSRLGRERKVLLHKILRVAHSVAQKAAKVAQNTPFLCSTAYRKLLICIRWGYYLANFKTAGFNRSPTPPFLILTDTAYSLLGL